ncbi:MAG: type II toxin-antitoxin system RelE/ParE family toxin [Bdellovibrionales bacterium]
MTDWLKVFIYDPARTEIQHWPLEVKKDFGSILTKLQKGDIVGYPDTKPVLNLAPGAFEIRLKDASGAYRAFFVVRSRLQEIETGKKRLKAFLKELADEN